MMMALALYLNSLKWEANKMKKKIFLVLTTLFMFINKYNAVINNDYNKTVNNLLAYCKLDTYAMVKIYEKILGLIK